MIRLSSMINKKLRLRDKSSAAEPSLQRAKRPEHAVVSDTVQSREEGQATEEPQDAKEGYIL